jgi:hypothetical protein
MCLARGFDNHLRKPIDYRELLSQVHRYGTGAVSPTARLTKLRDIRSATHSEQPQG